MKDTIRIIVCGLLAMALNAGTLYNGTLSGWTPGGDGSAVVLTQLGVADDAVPPSEVTLFPTLGSFVLVNNGPEGPASVATFSRPFVVGPGGGLLEFSGWFVTAEQTGTFAVAPGIDSFSVALSGDLNEILVRIALRRRMPPMDRVIFSFQTKYLASKLLGEGSYTVTFSVNDDPNDSESAVFDSGFLIDDTRCW